MVLTTQIAFNRRSVEKDKDFLQTLLTEVANIRSTIPAGANMDWNRLLTVMQEKFPSRAMSKESLRNRYRRLTDVRVNQCTQRKDDYMAGRMSLEQKVLNEIKTKKPLLYLCERFGVTEDKIFEVVAKLQMKGYRAVSIYDEDGVKFVHNRVRFYQTIPGMAGDEEGLDISAVHGGEIITFAVVSDTHVGNMMFAKKELEKFYDIIAERGITTVLHVGDLTDGYYIQRPTSIMEQDAVGFSNQLKKFVKDYPRREGITTYAITGNHDYSHMRNGFANMGEAVAAARDDIVYLGHNFGRLYLAKGLDVSLIHPVDGASAALSSKLRELIDRNSNRRSKIMLVGHYHKTAHEKYQGVYGYMVPSFEKKTPFMDDNNLTTDVAGMIFSVHTDKKGNILAIGTEYYDFS